MANQAELVIIALQQRIGEIVSNYETQIAFLRAELTKVSEEKESKFEAAEAYSEHLENISTVD
jgi:restriction endonuclease S subunit